jgi:hypothetical protein
VSSTTPDRRWSPALAGLVAALIAAACEFAPAPPEPQPEPLATTGAATAGPPAISIDETWTVSDRTWTFTGGLDPRGAATNVILEIGHDIANPRAFERDVPVAQDELDAGAISVAIEVPTGRPHVCVRFTATNAAGSGSSRPLCVSTSLPEASVAEVTPLPGASG